MFCTHCLTMNADDATSCSQCGRDLRPAWQTSPAGGIQQGYQARVKVPNYMVFAILVTMFCFLPTGILAMVSSAQVNNKLAVGDVEGARRASKNAQMWCLISVGMGLVMLVAFALFLFGVAGSPR